MSNQKKHLDDFHNAIIIFFNVLTILVLAIFIGIGWVLCKIFG